MKLRSGQKTRLVSMKYMLRFNSIRLSILLLFQCFFLLLLKAADNPTFSEENLLRVWHLENVSQGEQSQEKDRLSIAR